MQKGEPTFWRTTAGVFGVVFIAEWGDLTQLGTAPREAPNALKLAVDERWVTVPGRG